MTITQLEYLVAVHTHKSFAKAAKQCFVTQPTLSMQIKKVEEELNVLVFDRSKKPVLTTEIGEQIIRQARVAIQ
ncbi:MAG: LysR family transcriptional regulator, partial [Bacteroidota bacterium]